MYVHTCLLRPSQIDPHTFKYSLFYYKALETTYRRVYLKYIRFVIAHVATRAGQGQQVRTRTPYQIHIVWHNDRPSLKTLDTSVLQNTMIHGDIHRVPPFGAITYYPRKCMDQTHYSALCMMSCQSSIEDDIDDVDTDPNADSATTEHFIYNYYDMSKSTLLLEGIINSLHFEVFFTTLNGMRIYDHIPNVEIDLELTT